VLAPGSSSRQPFGPNGLYTTDDVEDVGAAEIHYLASLGVFTNEELLRLWSEVMPHAIFPKRRIGRIAPGYEASFIVLARSPLDDLKATSEILRWFKQGTEISDKETRASFERLDGRIPWGF
jgi:predicted amidohydrolase YtcJ